MDGILVAISLCGAFCFALGLVLTQSGLRTLTPADGACIAVPTTAVMFLTISPWTIDTGEWNRTGFIVFFAAGIFFPAVVTLLNFVANKRIGPNLTGALGNLSPAFAVALAVLVLGETPSIAQYIAIVTICAGVALLFAGSGFGAQPVATWLLLLPIAAACIRGLVQPAVKFGLLSWPNPFVAVTIGYCVSALVIALFAYYRGIKPWALERSGTLWFCLIGVVNGMAVLLLFAALARGPVTIVAPIVACYPVITMLLNRILLRDRALTPIIGIGVFVTVAGVVLLLAF